MKNNKIKSYYIIQYKIPFGLIRPKDPECSVYLGRSVYNECVSSYNLELRKGQHVG